MNKFTKAILSAGLALSILAGAGATAFAARKTDTKRGKIEDYTTRGSSSIEDLYASAYTSYDDTGSVYLRTTLNYIDLNLLKSYTETKSGSYYNYKFLDFRLHSHCRTLRLRSHHDVYALGQHWEADTDIIR